MGIDEIKSEIIKEAEEKSKVVAGEATEKAAKILNEAGKNAEHTKQNAKKEASKEAEKIMQTALSSARIEANKRVLKVKHEILSRTIEEAVAELISGKEYEENLKKAITANEKNALKIFLSRQDFEKFKALSSKLESRNMKGGFVARYRDFETNKTIEAALKINEHELAREAGKILFS